MAGLLNSGLVILYCGGFDNNNQVNTIPFTLIVTWCQESDACWRLRWGEQAWEEAPALPQAAVYAAQVYKTFNTKTLKLHFFLKAVLHHKMYVIGGFSGGEILDTLQVYDGQSWTLSKV